MLGQFVLEACQAPPTWTALQFIEEQVERIREQVGDEQVICALSGGVDSAVAALLVHRAVGDQLTCVFVDHGLLRKDEAERVVEAFEEHFQVPLVHVDAVDRFLDRLAGVTEPETKRRIIGEEFIRLFEDEARRLGDVRYLVQGTLYSDVIESGSAHRRQDQVAPQRRRAPRGHGFRAGRAAAADLQGRGAPGRRGAGPARADGVAAAVPRPGPGDPHHRRGHPRAAGVLREADAVLLEEIRRAGLYRELWQSFAILPAIRSVGVQGDSRTYAYPIVIRAVTSEDAMTADWARLPYDLLERISSRIINEIPGVNRVALDISSKPPSTIEWE